MKKIFCLIFLMMFGLTAAAVAHPPAKVAATFDAPTRVLTVTIMHPVSDPSTHYIFKINVEVNGKTVLEQKIHNQSDPEQEKVSYLLADVKKGDAIMVTAYCNITGDNGATLTVP